MRCTPFGSGLTVPIAELACYAKQSQEANPKLKQVISLREDELAVLAAAIELEGTGIAAPTRADQLVVHAHTAFGAPRTQALDALPTISDHGLLQMVHVGADDDARPNDTGVQIQYVSAPSLTDGIALYEAAFGAHEPKTDFYEATALQVIASVLGFFEDEIELVP